MKAEDVGTTLNRLLGTTDGTIGSDAHNVRYRTEKSSTVMAAWRNGADMLSWIVFGLVCWTLGFVFVMVLMRVAGDEDRAARHEEKRLDPYSDVAITQTGQG